jgi:threonine/homoserine/homoserine lactone efflux protein
MLDGAQWMGFVAAAVVLVLVPGPNTLLILAHSLGSGRRAGLATVLGVETATLVHTGAAALGLSAVLSTSALSFGLMRGVGAAYLVVLGLRGLLGARRGLLAPDGVKPVRLTQAYSRAVLTNLLNPKVALFFLPLLPQFVNPEGGNVVLQFGILGLTLSAVGLCFGSALAIATGAIGDWLGRDAVASWLNRLTGGVLLVLGLRLALMVRG